MRSKPLGQVLDATAPPRGGKSIMGSWGPKIDGKTVFADLTERGNKGKFIHAVSSFVSGSGSINSNRKQPIFVGNTDNEGANSGGKVGSKEALRSNCGPRRAAQLRKDAGVPAWRYIYAGEFANQKKGPCSANSEGAWYVIWIFNLRFVAANERYSHAAEISLVFGTDPLKNNGPDTENEAKLSAELRRAWASFTKDPAHGLEKLGWPQYDKSSKS
jgi:hypothetical protein